MKSKASNVNAILLPFFVESDLNDKKASYHTRPKIWGLQTNILNSVQVFRFTKLRHRLFLTVNKKTGMDLPFPLPGLPLRLSIASLLMKPIGIISDYTPAKPQSMV